MRLSYRKEHKVNPRAFTLIELLIVVAIIAILAAIAVPNFLEAQVRAKVARVMSDMRTMATGLEMYRVDYNMYPFQGAVTSADCEATSVVIPVGVQGYVAPNDTKNGSPQKRYNKFVPYTLTTPVAYLNELLIDIFATGFEGPRPESHYYFYNNLDDSINWMLTDGGKTEAQISNMTHKRNVWGSWTLLCGGPDLDRLDISGPAVGTSLTLGYYDPTNGTVSSGDILRSQKSVAPHRR